MLFRHLVRGSTAAIATTLAAIASPSLAHEPTYSPIPQPSWQANRHHPDSVMPAEEREDWLAECRRRLSRRDSGLGGAAIGGVIGGIAGNRIAGRGHRTVGTIAGAAVGAAAGMAVDKVEDNRQTRDECEAYLDDYYAYYQGAHRGYAQHPNYGYPAHGYTMSCCQPMMMVPIMRMPRAEPECTETVEYEYEYVDAPPRPTPRKPAPDKRIKIVPDKRLKVK